MASLDLPGDLATKSNEIGNTSHRLDGSGLPLKILIPGLQAVRTVVLNPKWTIAQATEYVIHTTMQRTDDDLIDFVLFRSDGTPLKSDLTVEDYGLGTTDFLYFKAQVAPLEIETSGLSIPITITVDYTLKAAQILPDIVKRLGLPDGPRDSWVLEALSMGTRPVIGARHIVSTDTAPSVSCEGVSAAEPAAVDAKKEAPAGGDGGPQDGEGEKSGSAEGIAPKEEGEPAPTDGAVVGNEEHHSVPPRGGTPLNVFPRVSSQTSPESKDAASPEAVPAETGKAVPLNDPSRANIPLPVFGVVTPECCWLENDLSLKRQGLWPGARVKLHHHSTVFSFLKLQDDFKEGVLQTLIDERRKGSVKLRRRHIVVSGQGLFSFRMAGKDTSAAHPEAKHPFHQVNPSLGTLEGSDAQALHKAAIGAPQDPSGLSKSKPPSAGPVPPSQESLIMMRLCDCGVRKLSTRAGGLMRRKQYPFEIYYLSQIEMEQVVVMRRLQLDDEREHTVTTVLEGIKPVTDPEQATVAVTPSPSTEAPSADAPLDTSTILVADGGDGQVSSSEDDSKKESSKESSVSEPGAEGIEDIDPTPTEEGSTAESTRAAVAPSVLVSPSADAKMGPLVSVRGIGRAQSTAVRIITSKTKDQKDEDVCAVRVSPPPMRAVSSLILLAETEEEREDWLRACNAHAALPSYGIPGRSGPLIPSPLSIDRLETSPSPNKRLSPSKATGADLSKSDAPTAQPAKSGLRKSGEQKKTVASGKSKRAVGWRLNRKASLPDLEVEKEVLEKGGDVEQDAIRRRSVTIPPANTEDTLRPANQMPRRSISVRDPKRPASDDIRRHAAVVATKDVLQPVQISEGGSVFGQPLSALPVCSASASASDESQSGSQGLYIVPAFVKACVDYVGKHASETEGIFRLSGSASQIQALKSRVDSGQDPFVCVNEVDDPHTVAGALKLFLREMEEPLCPFGLYDAFCAASEITDRVARLAYLRALVQAVLPAGNRVLLAYLIGFLRRLAKKSTLNLMTSQNLALVFAPNVLRKERESPLESLGNTRFTNTVFLVLLNEFDDLFTRPLSYLCDVRASFAFSPTAPVEMGFDEGDVLHVHHVDAGGWWQAVHSRPGQRYPRAGLLPRTYVQVIAGSAVFRVNTMLLQVVVPWEIPLPRRESIRRNRSGQVITSRGDPRAVVARRASEDQDGLGSDEKPSSTVSQDEEQPSVPSSGPTKPVDPVETVVQAVATSIGALVVPTDGTAIQSVDAPVQATLRLIPAQGVNPIQPSDDPAARPPAMCVIECTGSFDPESVMEVASAAASSVSHPSHPERKPSVLPFDRARVYVEVLNADMVEQASNALQALPYVNISSVHAGLDMSRLCLSCWTLAMNGSSTEAADDAVVQSVEDALAGLGVKPVMLGRLPEDDRTEPVGWLSDLYGRVDTDSEALRLASIGLPEGQTGDLVAVEQISGELDAGGVAFQAHEQDAEIVPDVPDEGVSLSVDSASNPLKAAVVLFVSRIGEHVDLGEPLTADPSENELVQRLHRVEEQVLALLHGEEPR